MHSITRTSLLLVGLAAMVPAGAQAQQYAAAEPIAVSANPAPAVPGQTVLLHAKVAGSNFNGTVNFHAGQINLGTVPVNPVDGTAVLPVDTEGYVPGSYTVSAEYSGDAQNRGVLGQGRMELVPATTSGSLSMTDALHSTNPTATITSGSTAQVDFQAAAPASDRPFSGTVTLQAGNSAIATLPVNAAGHASTQLANVLLPANTYQFRAVYSGDAFHQASTTQAVPVTVRTEAAPVLTATAR